jgi:3'-phosphoadenosine 5'-phosphosulfate sulfotransferase (PAPS reductase)/FAD synthetase
MSYPVTENALNCGKTYDMVMEWAADWNQSYNFIWNVRSNSSNWETQVCKYYAKESNEFAWHTHSVNLDQDPCLLQN